MGPPNQQEQSGPGQERSKLKIGPLSAPSTMTGSQAGGLPEALGALWLVGSGPLFGGNAKATVTPAAVQ